MHLSQFTQLVLDWKVVNTDEDLAVSVVVIWVHLGNQLEPHHVKHWNDQCWLLSKPNSQRRNLVRKVSEVNLE